MMALLVWWFALPTVARRLIGASLVAGLTFGGLLVWHHRAYQQGYASGYVVARDSVWKKEIQHRQVVLDSMERVADARAKAARDSSSALVGESQRFVTTPRHTPRIEPIPLAAGIDTALVSVYVESTGERFAMPRQAARYWYVSDSLVGVAKVLLDKYARANAQWASAWQAEHDARIGADSLAAAYAERLRAVELVPRSKARRWPYVALGLAVGFIAAKHIR